MIVVGAGMAGLLAAGMLRGECSAVYEEKPSLPNNHSAVLRFRSSVVGDALNIPFRKVQVLKAVAPWKNSIADALSYSRKTNGSGTLRSIAEAGGGLETRWIAPKDLVSQMAYASPDGAFRWGSRYAFGHDQGPVISTIPMPILMKALGWETKTTFRHRKGLNIVVEFNEEMSDAFCSLYVPNPDFAFARISITGRELVAECYDEDDVELIGASQILQEKVAEEALALVGLPMSWVNSVSAKEQTYAKILPIDENERRKFMMWASEKFRVFSLGRFATWRPGLLLDDLVKDVRVIQELIRNPGATYSHKTKGH